MSMKKNQITVFIGFAYLFLGYTNLKPCMAQNQITNGNFNASDADWTFIAPATAVEAYNYEPTYGGTDGTNRVAEIDYEANLQQLNIAVTAGIPYFFSLRHSKRNIAPSPNIIHVKIYNGTDVFLDEDIISDNTSWLWQCKVFTFTPAASQVSLDIVYQSPNTSSLGTIIDDITLTPQQQEIIQAGNACQGGTVTLTAPASIDGAMYNNYEWTGPNGFSAYGSSITFTNVQPADNGLYTCTMTMNECLNVSGSYTLDVTPSTFMLNESICKGETYDFYGRNLYQGGTYDTLILSDDGSCDSFIILTLTINPLPETELLPNEDLDMCQGDTAILAVLQPDPNENYQWLENNDPIGGETGTFYYADHNGAFSFSATNNFNCTDTSPAIRIYVHEPPSADILPLVEEDRCSPDTISLSARYQDDQLYYSWAPPAVFRPLDEGELPHARGIFTEEVNLITLTVTDSYGCSDTASMTIYTRSCCVAFFPTAFTPNTDGLNDYYRPYLNSGQRIIGFNIFDRWGGRVYTNNDPDQGWDGRYPDGTPANTGTYMYQISYSCGIEDVISEKGDLILIR